MFDFKKMLEDDLADVFLNIEEFAVNVTVRRGDEQFNLVGIFDIDSESVFDGGSEFGETSGLKLSLLVKKGDETMILANSIIEIEGESYRMLYKQNEIDLVRVFLEKRKR